MLYLDVLMATIIQLLALLVFLLHQDRIVGGLLMILFNELIFYTGNHVVTRHCFVIMRIKELSQNNSDG